MGNSQDTGDSAFFDRLFKPENNPAHDDGPVTFAAIMTDVKQIARRDNPAEVKEEAQVNPDKIIFQRMDSFEQGCLNRFPGKNELTTRQAHMLAYNKILAAVRSGDSELLTKALQAAVKDKIIDLQFTLWHVKEAYQDMEFELKEKDPAADLVGRTKGRFTMVHKDGREIVFSYDRDKPNDPESNRVQVKKGR